MADWTEDAADVVNVGLDFGTSSTKVFWRPVSGGTRREVTLLGFPDPGEGYPDVALPSSIRIAEGRIWLGREAESPRREGTLFRSLKVCLASSHGGVKCRCQSNIHQGSQAIFVDESGLRRVVQIEALATILVAGIVTNIFQRIATSLGTGQFTTLYNFAAPLDQVETPALRSVFERVAHHAILLAGRIQNGMSFDDALHHYHHISGENVPPEPGRVFAVFPEAIAAIHGYTNSPDATEGLYAVVDVGAGTTTVSFFRLAGITAERRVVFYASRTGAVGADDMDRALTDAVISGLGEVSVSRRREILRQMRAAKQNMTVDGLVSDGVVLGRAECRVALQPVFDRVFEVFRECFFRAYEKEQLQSRWEELTLVFVGGGSLVLGLEERLRASPHSFIERVHVRSLQLPQPLRLEGCGAISARDARLLSVGYGLSHPAPSIPDYWRPTEVEPMGPVVPPTPIPDDWRQAH